MYTVAVAIAVDDLEFLKNQMSSVCVPNTLINLPPKNL